MPPTEIVDEAFTQLKILAKWVYENAEMKQQEKNLLKCVDKELEDRVEPLLESLGYQIQVHREVEIFSGYMTKIFPGTWLYDISHIRPDRNYKAASSQDPVLPAVYLFWM